jgi:hypothetical protein
VSRPSPAFRQARRCYGHLAGTLGVALRQRLEAAQLLQGDGEVYRLSNAGRRWAESFGFDTDDRHLPQHARCCLDGTEREFHLGGRLGRTILTYLLDQGVLIPDGARVLRHPEIGRVWAVLRLEN